MASDVKCVSEPLSSKGFLNHGVNISALFPFTLSVGSNSSLFSKCFCSGAFVSDATQ